MRIAITYQRVDPSKGGAETYVADLCRRLVRLGHDVTLFANEWNAEALTDRIRCVEVEASGWTRAGRIWSFAENSEAALRADRHDCSIGLINTWHQDVLIPQGGVHAGSLEANARRFPEGWRRSLYVASKRSNPKWWGLYRAIERKQYDPTRSTRVVAVSEMVKRHLERFHRVPPGRIRVIPNAIDADRLSVKDPAAIRAEIRARHGLNEGNLTALFVAHNFRLKGLFPLLEALARRMQIDPTATPIHLLVCGAGKLDPVRKAVAALGLEKTVHPIGFAPSVRDYFHAADFFVLPSYYDPCSLVVFEALACGLPVITTAQNGAGEVITRGREGFVIPEPDDLDALVRVLGHMIDDGRRRLMSKWAVELGRAQSFDRHVARLLELCGEVAESKRQAPISRARPAWDDESESRESGRPIPCPERTEGIMQAIVLAGGKGTRLRPFTHVFPKPLMPLGDDNPMPILEVVLRQLARFGFDDVAIITGYLSEFIETFCRDGRRFGTRISYRREVTPLGTAGGLTLIDRPKEPVLVLNGDILTTLDFSAMYDFHRQSGARATIAAFPRKVRIDFGVLDFAKAPHVLSGYREKPEFSFEVSMGLYVLDPCAWDYLRPGSPLPMPDLLEAMRGDGLPVHAFRQDCEWLDIGRHDDYAAANELFQARRAAFLGNIDRPNLKIG